MQLSASQRGLEHVAGVHRAFGLARADHRVQFVDEQDDLPLLLGQIVQYGLQAFLELAAELRAGNQGAHVERQNPFALQTLGDLAVDDSQREPFDDRGLTNAGLTDQHRVVLGPTLQDLDRATDFVVAADHRIQLAG